MSPQRKQQRKEPVNRKTQASQLQSFSGAPITNPHGARGIIAVLAN